MCIDQTYMVRPLENTSSFFRNGKLFLSVAVFTTDRQASCAFLQAEDRPMFKGLKSDSTARSHVCPGRPIGHLPSLVAASGLPLILPKH